MKTTLLMAQTVDGKIARGENELINWTSKEDKKFFVSETKRVGVIIMGRKTYETFGRPLPGRRIIVMTRQVRENINGDGTVEFTDTSPQEILKKLESEGREEVILAGGPTINKLFLEANLIDEIKLSVEPKIFGSGLALFEGAVTDRTLELIEIKNITPHVLVLHYRIVK